MSKSVEHANNDDAITFESLWQSLSLEQQLDYLSMQTSLHESSIQLLAKSFISVNNTVQQCIHHLSVNDVHAKSNQQEDLLALRALVTRVDDVIGVQKVLNEAEEKFKNILNDNSIEDEARKQYEDAEKMLWKFAASNNNNLKDYSERMMAKTESAQEITTNLPQKIDTIKKSAECSMEDVLRSSYQKQRYRFLKSFVRDLENTYNKQMMLNDANVTSAVDAREDTRSRIKKLYDRLEAITVRQQKSREEHQFSEQNLESELNCLKHVRDILLSSNKRGEAPETVVDVEQGKLIELRRQRACLLIQKSKATAILQRLAGMHKYV